MQTTTSSPKPGETAWLWLLKILSGVLIVVVLGIHFVVNHYLAPEGLLDYAGVVAYYQNLFVPIMEGAFLVLVVVHSLLGVRGIVLDLNPTSRVLRIFDISITLFGCAAIVYGLWLLSVVVSQGAG